MVVARAPLPRWEVLKSVVAAVLVCKILIFQIERNVVSRTESKKCRKESPPHRLALARRVDIRHTFHQLCHALHPLRPEQLQVLVREQSCVLEEGQRELVDVVGLLESARKQLQDANDVISRTHRI